MPYDPTISAHHALEAIEYECPWCGMMLQIKIEHYEHVGFSCTTEELVCPHCDEENHHE